MVLSILSSKSFQFLVILNILIERSNLTVISDFTGSGPTRRNLAPADPGLFKRIRNGRPMDQCPQGNIPPRYAVFSGSRCRNQLDSFAFAIDCGYHWRKYLRKQTAYGSCPGSEFCVDALLGGLETAWCVNKPSVTAALPAQDINTYRKGGFNLARPTTPVLAGQLMLVHDFLTRSLVKAYQITVVPTDTAGNMLDQPTTCTGCSVLSFTNIPVHAARLEIYIALRRGADTAIVVGFFWD